MFAKGEHQFCGLDKLGGHWFEPSTAHTFPLQDGYV